MKFLSSLIIVAFLLNTTNVHADQPQLAIKLPTISSPSSESDLGAVISPLIKTQKAPFSGLLLSPRAIAEIIAEISSYEEAVTIEKDRLIKEHSANLDRELIGITLLTMFAIQASN